MLPTCSILPPAARAMHAPAMSCSATATSRSASSSAAIDCADRKGEGSEEEVSEGGWPAPLFEAGGGGSTGAMERESAAALAKAWDTASALCTLTRSSDVAYITSGGYVDLHETIDYLLDIWGNH